MNRGIDLEREQRIQDGTECMFGGMSLSSLVSIPLAEREQYLPQGEQQNLGDEKMDCASRGPVNIYASLFTYGYRKRLFHVDNLKWLKDNGYVNSGISEEYDWVDFSDRFIAILSGTTRSGNSLKEPLQTIHEKGLIPKPMFPQVPSWDEYYSGITQEMKDLGAEFARRFELRYEQVNEIHFANLLKDDFLNVAVHAWPQEINGEYPRTDGQFNHVVELFKPKYYAFDNYLDNDFVKKLAENYDFWDYAYRPYIEREDPNATKKLVSLYEQLIQALKRIVFILSGKV